MHVPGTGSWWRAMKVSARMMEAAAAGPCTSASQMAMSTAGQRRRAGLAMLQLSSAKLWILDEPMTNLDRDGRTLIVSWIKQHLSLGGSAVIATHQPDEFAAPGSLLIELS